MARQSLSATSSHPQGSLRGARKAGVDRHSPPGGWRPPRARLSPGTTATRYHTTDMSITSQHVSIVERLVTALRPVLVYPSETGRAPSRRGWPQRGYLRRDTSRVRVACARGNGVVRALGEGCVPPLSLT